MNGEKPKFGSPAGNDTEPESSAVAADGDVPRSQSLPGAQPAVVDATPSHCSTNTCAPTAKPVADTVNDCG